ncbi:MAG: DUF6264 family protein [Pseudolysinimonas sp.]|uniref:DUF6264 family protein n=1 Tax=Pseudolysinimonas sp. TaxID=2680009 RepID=UPI0032639AE7
MSEESLRPASRPAPQYGEYATPEEVAALRGTPLDAQLVVTPAPPNAPPTNARPPVSRDVPVVPVLRARRFDPMITIALLVFGAVNVVQTAPYYLAFDNLLEVSTAHTPLEKIDFGEAARVGGYWLLAIGVVLMVAAVVISFARLRRSRITFWVPLTAAALMLVATVATLAVVLAQTPGAFSTVG